MSWRISCYSSVVSAVCDFQHFTLRMCLRLDTPLQVTQHCPTDVAEWDTLPGTTPTLLATRHTGLCGTCARDLASVKDDELLSGVTTFGARNAQDPLDGFPASDVDTLTGLQFHVLFREASVLEAMLVALHHMQVSVCRFDGRRDRRTGLTRFRKKHIISFPQRVSELQQHAAFVSNVRVNDVVNAVYQNARGHVLPSSVRRARVVDAQPDGFYVQFAGDSDRVLVRREDLRARLTLPWRPSDLHHAIIVLRRRRGHRDEYVEDLRVRRNFVVALLRCLSRCGHWRAHRGVEPMHAYYTEFDWLSAGDIDELLPEDGVPTSLPIHEEDDEDEKDALSSVRFQQWLWEGRHDGPIALAMLRLFAGIANRGNASVADFFIDLYEDYMDSLGNRRPAPETPMLLPVTFMARRICELQAVPFETTGLTSEELHAQLVEQIWEEVHSVEAFMTAWTGSTVLPKPEERALGDHIVDACTDAVAPWPTIERDPTAPYEDGRFVKAFPLEFPMGQGDFHQARLRDDFSVQAWAQHKFRYWDGRFLASARGHRVTWAIFNTTLLDTSRSRGRTFSPLPGPQL